MLETNILSPCCIKSDAFSSLYFGITVVGAEQAAGRFFVLYSIPKNIGRSSDPRWHTRYISYQIVYIVSYAIWQWAWFTLWDTYSWDAPDKVPFEKSWWDADNERKAAALMIRWWCRSSALDGGYVCSYPAWTGVAIVVVNVIHTHLAFPKSRHKWGRKITREGRRSRKPRFSKLGILLYGQNWEYGSTQDNRDNL